MRVIIFSWEYPPRVVGQLSEYINGLSTELVKNKVETYIVTYHDVLTGSIQETSGVKTVRVTNPVRTHNGELTWALTLNQEVERAAANIYYQIERRIDLIDVYDWHFIPAAVILKNALGIPFIYSVESLEDHRSQTANTPYNMAIKSVERLGFYEASRVIVKSKWMQNEITRIYETPKEKMKVILPNKKHWIKKVLNLYKTVARGINNK
jgi:hypothetical protein